MDSVKDSIIAIFAAAITVVGVILGLGLLISYPVMWTWNYTFPDVFGLPEIDVWQALWGSVCIRLIFPSSYPMNTKK